MKQPDIIACLKSKALFGSLEKFGDLSSWQSWLTALRALFGLPMDADDLARFRRFTGRSVPPPGGSKEAFIIVGRRGGKSYISAVIAVYMSFFQSFEKYIAGGERACVLVLAVDKQQAKIVFSYARAIINAIPTLRNMVVSWKGDEVALSNGLELLVKASDFRSLRGVTVVCCIADELSFWQSQGVSPDSEVLTAIRPAMATIPSAKLVAISSGYAQIGVMYDSWKQHFGRDDSPVLVWQADTRFMNPSIPQEFIDAEIARDPVNAVEYGGGFRDDVSACFSIDTLEACVIPQRRELPRSPHIQCYFGFVDPSGGRHDQMTAAISHVSHDGKLVLDALRYTRPPFDPGEVCKRYADFFKLYGVTEVTGDNYSAEFVASEFAKNGISYLPSERTKSELYLALIPLLSARQVELLDDPKMLDEFRRLERHVGRNGRDTVDHGLKGSDDICNAAAGAIILVSLVAPMDWNAMAQINLHSPARRLIPGLSLEDQIDGGAHPVDELLGSTGIRGRFDW